MRARAGLRISAVVVALSVGAGITPGGWTLCLAAPPEFVVPVSGPIVRRFQAPLGPYAAGHRGIDFGVSPGTAVVASASGKVLFAGPVADDGLFVTIQHGEIKTTYSFLSEISVVSGQEVRQGHLIGRSGEGHPGEGRPVLHFGAKIGDHYIDPEILLFGNLDDISNLIALAPFEESGSGGLVGAASSFGGGAWPGPANLGKASGFGSSSLRPADLASAERRSATAAPSARRSPFIALGRAIATFAGSVKEASVKVVDAARSASKRSQNLAAWTKERLSKLARFSRGALERAAERLGAGADRATRSLDRLKGAAKSFWAKLRDQMQTLGGGLERQIGKVGRVLSQVKRWSIKAFNAAADWLGDRFSRAKRWLSRIAGRFWRRGGRSLRLFSRRLTLIKDVAVFVGGMAKGAIDQIRCSKAGGARPPDLPTREELAKGVKPPPPPSDNVVVAIAGLGSSSTVGKNGAIDSTASMYTMDVRTLGFHEDQIFHFSYKGIEQNSGNGPYRLHAPYSKEDTYKSIAESARQLGDQLQVIHAMYRNKKIDLVAHSQGGLVAQYYLTMLYRPERFDRARIDHFISIGTPHDGADAAQLGPMLSNTPQGRLILKGWDELADLIGLPRPSSPAALQLAEDSQFIADLRKRWDPKKVSTTTIAATFDFVVTSPHTRLRGAAHYTADLAGVGPAVLSHGNVVSAESTKGIIYNTLGGRPLECTALRNAFADHGPGRLFSEVEDTALETFDAFVDASFHFR
jgi:pimeloyl-ACP methyl ester carboxylesterase